jgi:hypothetical protein
MMAAPTSCNTLSSIQWIYSGGSGGSISGLCCETARAATLAGRAGSVLQAQMLRQPSTPTPIVSSLVFVGWVT